MRLLVVSPDYLSHYLPLSAVAADAAGRGIDVTVATGSGLAGRVQAAGWTWAPLRMSRGSNTGIAAVDDPDDDLRAFFAATRHGMVATLAHQAAARRHDLLWDPVTVARDALAVVDDVRPDAILVDHLAFAVTMALRARGIPFTTFVPGHPSQLPAAGERYGFPVGWPTSVTPDPAELAALRRCCDEVTASFTAAYRDATASIGGDASDVVDAFTAHGADVLYNSPAALHPPGRVIDHPHAFLGACRRTEVADGDVRRWLDADGAPLVYVSFGTFLSARDDVLRRVLDALTTMDVRVAVATGRATSAQLGPLPSTWLVAPQLPQVAVLDRAAAAVSHAGNGTVTEALAVGAPIVALPFSTDQFAIAADLERTGVGRALDANGCTAADVGEAVEWALGPAARAAAGALAADHAARPGATVAVDRLVAGA